MTYVVTSKPTFYDVRHYFSFNAGTSVRIMLQTATVPNMPRAILIIAKEWIFFPRLTAIVLLLSRFIL